MLISEQLWDVCSDQEAVDLVRQELDPVTASKQLVEYALARFSTDNLSCMIVRLHKTAIQETATTKSIGVEGDKGHTTGKVSEVEKIVADAKRKVVEGGAPVVGVSGSNSGKGHDPATVPQPTSKPTGPSKETKEASPKENTEKDAESSKDLFKGFALGNSASSMERVVEEEPSLVKGDAPEIDTEGVRAISPERRKALTKGIPESSAQE